jgi:hypothetical protein
VHLARHVCTHCSTSTHLTYAFADLIRSDPIRDARSPYPSVSAEGFPVTTDTLKTWDSSCVLEAGQLVCEGVDVRFMLRHGVFGRHDTRIEIDILGVTLHRG